MTIYVYYVNIIYLVLQYITFKCGSINLVVLADNFKREKKYECEELWLHHPVIKSEKKCLYILHIITAK